MAIRSNELVSPRNRAMILDSPGHVSCDSEARFNSSALWRRRTATGEEGKKKTKDLAGSTDECNSRSFRLIGGVECNSRSRQRHRVGGVSR